MRYLFQPELLLSIQNAFHAASIVKEPVEFSAVRRRDYFFLKFGVAPTTVFHDTVENNLVGNILSGDKKLSELANQVLHPVAQIELGFRWSGIVEHTKKIIFHGFCFKIIYSAFKEPLQNGVIHQLGEILKQADLIKPDHTLAKQFSEATLARAFTGSAFYRLNRPRKLPEHIVQCAKTYIANNIAPIAPAYVRPNETGINPAYQDTASVKSGLYLNQKKIWLLRGDGIVAIGNKNAYWTNFSENGLSEAISPELHRYVNWEDRFGHPSLACPHPGYTGSAFYGGLLAQRTDCLDVYTSSGRYYRNDLSENHKAILEAFLANEFQQTFGEQRIVFMDAPSYLDYFECSFFYFDKPLPAYCARRMYDFSKIENILSGLATPGIVNMQEV